MSGRRALASSSISSKARPTRVAHGARGSPRRSHTCSAASSGLNPAPLREFWTTVTGRLAGNRQPNPAFRYGPWADIQFKLAGALAAAGVPLLSGTDLPNVVLVPGESLLRELAMLHEAGLSNYQVLEATTVAPARFFGQANDWGTVEAGHRANLILVDASPLKDLSALSALDAVFLAGRMYDAHALAAMRDGIWASPAR